MAGFEISGKVHKCIHKSYGRLKLVNFSFNLSECLVKYCLLPTVFEMFVLAFQLKYVISLQSNFMFSVQFIKLFKITLWIFGRVWLA